MNLNLKETPTEFSSGSSDVNGRSLNPEHGQSGQYSQENDFGFRQNVTDLSLQASSKLTNKHQIDDFDDDTSITNQTKRTSNASENGNVHNNDTLMSIAFSVDTRRSKFLGFPQTALTTKCRIPVRSDSKYRFATSSTIHCQCLSRAVGTLPNDTEPVNHWNRGGEIKIQAVMQAPEKNTSGTHIGLRASWSRIPIRNSNLKASNINSHEHRTKDRETYKHDEIDSALSTENTVKSMSGLKFSKDSFRSATVSGTDSPSTDGFVNRARQGVSFSDAIFTQLEAAIETLRVASDVLKHSSLALENATTLLSTSLANKEIIIHGTGSFRVSQNDNKDAKASRETMAVQSAVERGEQNNRPGKGIWKKLSKIPVPIRSFCPSLLGYDMQQYYQSILDLGERAMSPFSFDNAKCNKRLDQRITSRRTCDPVTDASTKLRKDERLLRRSSPTQRGMGTPRHTDVLQQEVTHKNIDSLEEYASLSTNEIPKTPSRATEGTFFKEGLRNANPRTTDAQVVPMTLTESNITATQSRIIIPVSASKTGISLAKSDTGLANALSGADGLGPTTADTASSISCNSHIPLPYLPSGEVNRYKNIHLAQVLIPQVFSVVLKWGCSNKQEEETFMEYLKREKSVSTRQLKNYYKISPGNVDLLKREKNSSALDVTVLFPLIQLACEGLEDRYHPIWFVDDDTKPECLLTKAKEQRNKICHGVRSEAVSQLVFDKGKTILMKLLKVSGKLFEQDENIIKHELETFTDQVEALALTSEERRLIDLQHMFHTEGLAESKSYWQEYCTTDAVPFTDDIVKREKVFHPMEVYVRDVSSPDADPQKISYTKILEKSDVEGTRASIIRGDAGSGKTTVMKNMSLQFLGIVPNEVKFLDEIHLLLSLECRDRQVKSLKEFIENNFPKTCRKVTTDEALKCFSYIGNLIFVDGVDELNECSAQVIKEIIHAMKSTMPFCHIIFSTRPHAAIALESFLKKEGIPFHSYELVKIAEEKDQLEFLSRYENTCSNSTIMSGMREAFRALKDEVKEFFVYPINLILFCYLFLYSPESIKKWENSNDVIGQILVLYEMFIERKLIEYSIANLKFRIRELLCEVNCYALECLAKNKILLSETQFQEIQDRCATKLAEWGLLQVDANMILSVVFLTKFSPTACSKPTYQFFHRSIQEMMAGRALAKVLKELPNVSTSDVLKKQLGIVDKVADTDSIQQGSFSRFLNVLRFVVISLTEFEADVALRGHLLQLMAILNEERPEFDFWAGLVLSCPTSEEVAMAAAKAYPRESWTVSSPGEVAVAARVMRHLQIRLVKVSLARTFPTPAALQGFLQTLTETHSGGLWLELHHSFRHFAPIDDLLLPLQSAKFHVREFRGCLGFNQEAAQVLAAAVVRSSRAAKLEISLAEPEQHHLTELQGARYSLNVRVRVTGGSSTPRRRPLPEAPKRPPVLTVECCQDSKAKEVADIIVALAPDDHRYCLLQLQQWAQDDSALDQLLQTLAVEGIRTAGFGDARWEPALTDYNEDCSVCQGTDHRQEERCVELWLP